MLAPDAPPVMGWRGARIVVGVCGGIAAYKAADVVSALVQGGASVDVVLTGGAQRFIQPLTFEALTHRRVYSDVFDGWDDGGTGHVSIARDADAVLIAPATANTIARVAAGMVDDMLSAVVLDTQAPVLIAPAMEHRMWHHPATRRNVETLRGDGATIIEPDAGYLASGARGDGRLPPRARILFEIRRALGGGGVLAGRRVVVSAGGTREPLDPVRYLGNRSSGRMGVALALAALDAGADVTLVATPAVDREAWAGTHVEVERAVDMEGALADAIVGADALIMAAAVADFRPLETAARKIKKRPGQGTLTLDLVRNPDILQSIESPGLIKVGFAAESEDLIANARGKLESKGLDMIVANDAVTTIGSPRSQATLLFRDRESVELPDLGKDELAHRIMVDVVRLVNDRDDHA